MNRLWVRLTLAFVAVTLVAVITVALLADTNIGRDFRQYAAGQAAALDPLVATLGDYYAQRGTWEGVEAAVPGAGGAGRGQGRGQGYGGPDMLVADAQGRIVYDGGGMRVGQGLRGAFHGGSRGSKHRAHADWPQRAAARACRCRSHGPGPAQSAGERAAAHARWRVYHATERGAPGTRASQRHRYGHGHRARGPAACVRALLPG